MAPTRRRVSKGNTNNDHGMSWSQSIHETVKGSHEYKIKGYSLAKGMGAGEYMASGEFTVGGHEWVILFNPDGNTEDSKEYVSVYLELVSPGQEAVRALFEFKLLDQSGKNKYGTAPDRYLRTFETGRTMWGWDEYMKRSDLETSTFLKDDCLSIHCAVEVVVQNHVESSARCPVFKAQFSGLVGNPDMETVTIEEFDPFAFKAMLLFLYSDEIPEPSELSDLYSHCTSTTIMRHLLAAADRFVFARLKVMCEAKLCEEITTDSVATTLGLADRYQCLQLKTACLNFAAKPENLEEVMKSDGFAHFDKSNSSLLIDLLKASAVLNKK
ncbi:BTB/POZ and MATH domain-containing protein 3-like [Papaver somniferum]|uniref:BTB/POZ and MATH domain-containing protein 3-like n=1 Tax=Papaver somniferum TaxID=3469 RepID=UPI000E6FC82B|nr:BTB/POZ and MATH domain-containing protein 3-like [Papaver somniferum]